MNRILPAVFLILILLSGASDSFSQTPEANAIDSTKFLDEVTVAANRKEESRKNIAQEFMVLTAREIKFLQPQTTADLVAQSGNVSVQKSQQGGGSPVIRGFEASRILLVVDGVRMNNIIYRSGHLQNILTIDNNSIERLEILSGPSSSMYGSDALGGVIAMTTKNPKFSENDSLLNISAGAMLRYASSNSESTGNIHFNIGGRKFASFTSVTYSSFDDLKGGKTKNWFYDQEYGQRYIYADRINGKDSIVTNNNPEEQIQSGYNQFDLLQKFTYSSKPGVQHQLNFQYSTTSDVPRYDRLTDPNGAGLSYANWYYGPQERLLTIYSLSIKKNLRWMDTFHLAASYQKIQESRHTRRFGNDNLQHRTEDVNIGGLNIDLYKKLRNNELHYGIEAQYNSLKSTAYQENIMDGNIAALNTRYPDGDNMMLLSSAYISHNWHINEKWSLVDGFRFGYSLLKSSITDTTFFPFPYNETSNASGQFAFNAGLIYRPTEKLKTSALVSSGYRVPNVDDLSKIFESAPGTLIVPNPDLGPEKTLNAELNATWEPSTTFSWENTVYATRFNDAIVTSPYQYNGQDSILYDGVMSKVFANQNMRKATIMGFSSIAQVHVADNWTIRLTAAYTYGRIKTDSTAAPLDHISPFMARLQCTYAKNKLRADFISSYNGWKKIEDYYLNGEDNEQYATPEGMPTWIVFNLKLGYQVNKYLLLQAGCDNLLDMQYRVFSSGINAPGRNFMVTARFNY
jgi:hemoglobin/transferrin/lactoferrin receptor protein